MPKERGSFAAALNLRPGAPAVPGRAVAKAASSIAMALLAVIITVASGSAGEARDIDLVDGSVITGEIVSAAGGVYTIRTGSLGTIQIEEGKIRAIRARGPAPAPAPAASQEEAKSLLFRMMADRQVMSMITALQNDPEFQKVLEDPAVMAAVISGNTAALMGNEQFMKLLENKTVQDIMKKMAP